jgi:hypothetical protein
LTDTRWEYDVTKLVNSIESIGIRPSSRSKRGAATPKWKTAAAVSAVGGVGVVLASLAIYGGASWFNRPPSSSTDSKISSVSAQVAQMVDTVRTTQDNNQQMQRALERERKERQEAERTAELERQRRRAREDDLDRARREREPAAKRVEPEPSQPQPVSRTKPSDFGGTQGRVRVSWQHEGVIYTAFVSTNGAKGSALVNYVDPQTGIQVGAEQDLELVRNAEGVFYVGANPRLPGTTIPHPFYMRDIFRLSSLANGNWTISEVGPNWGHFDRAATIGQ